MDGLKTQKRFVVCVWDAIKWIEQQTVKQQQRGQQTKKIFEESPNIACVCARMYDIDLTDKSFHARVNPQKRQKKSMIIKLLFRSLW